jgi:hypothetical protein
MPGLPHGAKVVLSTDSSGRCVFLEADRRCAVHRQLGPEALAAACRDFPRIVTLTPLGVSITLSHYCPTAAAMLFAPVILRDSVLPGPEGSAVDGAGLGGSLGSGQKGLPRDDTVLRDDTVRILENPPGFPSSWPYEGLDARDALPPLLRPGVLMDWPGLERWELFTVSVLADEARSPEAALDVLASAAERARRWTPADGPFAEYFQTVLSSRGASVEPRDEGSAAIADPSSQGPDGTPRDDTGAWRLVAACVPHRALLPPTPQGLDEVDERWVAPVWPALALPVRRWLAAKAFASWLVLQGDGLRTAVLGLRVSLGVLRAEAARGCAEAGRTLDGDLLKEALRRADLLLVHLADPEALARRLATL